MLSAEYGEFETCIRQLEKLFGKSIDDDTIKAYWNALRDLPLGLVQKKAWLHQRHGKFFPKPVELRPRDEKPGPEASPARDQEFKRLEDQNIRMWEEWLRADPETARAELRKAYQARANLRA